jgi:hypothetical protein
MTVAFSSGNVGKGSDSVVEWLNGHAFDVVDAVCQVVRSIVAATFDEFAATRLHARCMT